MVYDNEDSMSGGVRGPLVMEDVWLFEKHTHFNREVIPERRMHAKGSGAFGHFVVTHDITKYSKAKLFNEIGKVTPMLSDSREAWQKDNARNAHLNTPSTPACPLSAKVLPREGCDTNAKDVKSLFDWKTDPQVL